MFAPVVKNIQRILDTALRNENGTQHLVCAQKGRVYFYRAAEHRCRLLCPGQSFENQTIIEQQLLPVGP